VIRQCNAHRHDRTAKSKPPPDLRSITVFTTPRSRRGCAAVPLTVSRAIRSDNYYMLTMASASSPFVCFQNLLCSILMYSRWKVEVLVSEHQLMKSPPPSLCWPGPCPGGPITRVMSEKGNAGSFRPEGFDVGCHWHRHRSS
jgi:hypothetical protein